MHRRILQLLPVFLLFLLVFPAADAALAAGDGDPGGDLEPGFLVRGLAAQQDKAFDVGGNFTIGGFLGVGTDAPVRSVHLRDRNAVFRMDRDVNTAAFLLVRTAQNDFGSVLKTYAVGVDATGTNTGSFVINDLGTAVTGGGARRLTIGNTGNVGINTTAAIAALQVHGTGSPFLFGLVDGAAIRLIVDAAGVMEINTNTAVGWRATTPGGHNLAGPSTLLSDVGHGTGEESWLALDGNNALIASPGDGSPGILALFDQDQLEFDAAALPRYEFQNDELRMRGGASKSIRSQDVVNGNHMRMSTAGDEIWMVVDENGDRPLVGGFVYRWFQGGTAGGNTVFGADQDGDFGITGTLFENNAFDIAEAFWKDEAAIEAGDVVRVSPASPHAVVLASRAADPAVLGVASTDPGIIMGGGAFSVGQLAGVWGDETAAIFESSRADLEAEALELRPDLLESALALQTFDGFMAREAEGAGSSKAALKPDDEERLRSEYGRQLARWQDDIEAAALELFFEQRFVRLALAGRVPVKADATFGAIRQGDLLVASPTPGHAMRADDPAPGTVVGKALEALDDGRGRVMMLVMLR